MRSPSAGRRGSAKLKPDLAAMPGSVVDASCHAARTPRTSDRSSISTLARNLYRLSFSTTVVTKARGTSRKKPPPSAAGASATKKSAMILPCGVNSAQKRATPGASVSTSAVTRPCRKFRAPSPATLTTPRSGSKAAFMAIMPKPAALPSQGHFTAQTCRASGEKCSFCGLSELSRRRDRAPRYCRGNWTENSPLRMRVPKFSVKRAVASSP